MEPTRIPAVASTIKRVQTGLCTPFRSSCSRWGPQFLGASSRTLPCVCVCVSMYRFAVQQKKRSPKEPSRTYRRRRMACAQCGATRSAIEEVVDLPSLKSPNIQVDPHCPRRRLVVSARRQKQQKRNMKGNDPPILAPKSMTLLQSHKPSPTTTQVAIILSLYSFSSVNETKECRFPVSQRALATFD